jgi:hypothetical protein
MWFIFPGTKAAFMAAPQAWSASDRLRAIDLVRGASCLQVAHRPSGVPEMLHLLAPLLLSGRETEAAGQTEEK